MISFICLVDKIGWVPRVLGCIVVPTDVFWQDVKRKPLAINTMSIFLRQKFSLENYQLF